MVVQYCWPLGKKKKVEKVSS
uniref:Uncharacterized protein n=1 Tax=Rhizophora mucronata TaxID=61149 RepID=A0A2P2P8B4_RHIMU